ncbi:MAG TPA: ArsA family ATPase [Longimicrobiaceae bacterium]|nr:ArsA family ATPase [Longimicrobiaceae bacterium]
MLPERLGAGPGWTFVGGKGGVGKTTVAAALAVALADSGERVLTLSVDPAHSLGDALGTLLGPEPAPVPGAPGLEAFETDAERERARFVAEHRETLLALAERGTYLDRADVDGFLDLALPGMDELAAVLRLLELADADPALRVVVDTAPTGHTLRLLDLTRTAGDWIAALEAMEARHRAVALALVGAYLPDPAARDLAALRAGVERLAACLADPARTRFVLVATPEPVVLAETRRYLAALRDRHVAVGALVVNRAPDGDAVSAADLGLAGEGVPVVRVPLLDPEPRGVEGARRVAAAEAALPPAPSPLAGEGENGATAALTHGPPWFPPTDRRLYLVGGKGGVGKSTVASALAARLAAEGRAPVLLMSTDPAGSLGDVWGAAVGADAVAAEGAPGLRLRQVDAAAEWEAFRAEYREQVERLFAGLGGPGISATADREVVARLVDLAPPGVDEAMALGDVIDLLEGGEYNALVLDTAPTGHLLRLLEMPAVALDWSHALLRLLLRYREVVGLGETAERVLRFSRTLRGLRGRLEDPSHTWLLAVALPEALSVPETERLAGRLRAMGVAPGALLVNRLLDGGGMLPGRAEEAARLLALPGFPEAAAAPEWNGPGPRGAAALLRFARSWRRLAPA